jgi:hypothetical protein
MTDKTKFDRAGAMWWTPTAEGGLRRIWVRKADDRYLCARELCSAEQEAARARVLEAGATHEPPSLEDIRVWCGAHFAQLRTSSGAEAWVFLGADEMAQCALEDCDPALVDAFVPGSPCEDLEAVHKEAVLAPGQKR